eukprot:m.361744 g.361744  ORF g.361744 m.361744 type:complete len:606 (-) comp28056_c1_seq2:168-1985(-)
MVRSESSPRSSRSPVRCTYPSVVSAGVREKAGSAGAAELSLSRRRFDVRCDDTPARPAPPGVRPCAASNVRRVEPATITSPSDCSAVNGGRPSKRRRDSVAGLAARSCGLVAVQVGVMLTAAGALGLSLALVVGVPFARRLASFALAVGRVRPRRAAAGGGRVSCAACATERLGCAIGAGSAEAGVGGAGEGEGGAGAGEGEAGVRGGGGLSGAWCSSSSAGSVSVSAPAHHGSCTRSTSVGGPKSDRSFSLPDSCSSNRAGSTAPSDGWTVAIAMPPSLALRDTSRSDWPPPRRMSPTQPPRALTGTSQKLAGPSVGIPVAMAVSVSPATSISVSLGRGGRGLALALARCGAAGPGACTPAAAAGGTTATDACCIRAISRSAFASAADLAATVFRSCVSAPFAAVICIPSDCRSRPRELSTCLAFRTSWAVSVCSLSTMSVSRSCFSLVNAVEVAALSCFTLDCAASSRRESCSFSAVSDRTVSSCVSNALVVVSYCSCIFNPSISFWENSLSCAAARAARWASLSSAAVALSVALVCTKRVARSDVTRSRCTSSSVFWAVVVHCAHATSVVTAAPAAPPLQSAAASSTDAARLVASAAEADIP